MISFAAVTFVGPGKTEWDRLVDLLASLFHYEPNVRYLVIVDDRSQQDFASLTVPGECKLVISPNPRQGRGQWWTGGLCVGLAAALDWLARHADIDFAIRLDTDSLVIAPFADQVAARFDKDRTIGILGTYQKYPNGTVRKIEGAEELRKYELRKLTLPLTVWRHSERGTRLQCLLFSPRARRLARPC